MAFFDALTFNPQGYGGQGGGLLDLLKSFQMQQAYNPAPHAGFGDAATPSNAQPTQGLGQPMQIAPQSNPPLPALEEPNRLLTGLQGFLGNLHNGPIGAIAGGIGALATGQRTDPGGIARQQANMTAQALVKGGLDPNLALTVASNPDLLKAVLPQVLGIGGQTDDIKEYQFAKKEEPNLTFQQFMQRKRAVSGEFGMQPIWGTGPDGKPAVLQLGKSGEAKQSVLPQGFTLARDPIKVEGPTGTSILDPQTRQQVAFIPKDVAGAAKQKEIGEAEGQATVNLPNVIATAENTLKTIKQMEEHPGKKNWGAFGYGAMLPDSPGSETRGFGQLVEQIKGQNFMTAFQALKGAGAITEQEGAKAERAQARLDRMQSEKDFNIAVKDLKEVIIAGMERARQKAGVKHNQPLPTAATPAPDPLGLR